MRKCWAIGGGVFLLIVLLAACAGSRSSSVHTEQGIASWYGPWHAGRLTANQEIFDPAQLTAAHKELPFNTIVEVKRIDDGRTVVVRINDRGPFVRGRIIDLSQRAAEELGMIREGIVPVEVRVLQ